MVFCRKKATLYLTWATVGLLSAIVFLAPFLTGLQEQHLWAVAVAFAVVVGALALTVRALAPQKRIRLDPVMISLVAIAGIFALQLLPLPAWLVGFLSPGRADLAAEASASMGDPIPTWISLTTCLKSTSDGLLLLVACVDLNVC